MTRPVEELEAELEVAKLEEQLRDAKQTSDGPSNELKLELREARRRFRELRQARPAGEGVARPETVATTAEVKE